MEKSVEITRKLELNITFYLNLFLSEFISMAI